MLRSKKWDKTSWYVMVLARQVPEPEWYPAGLFGTCISQSPKQNPSNICLACYGKQDKKALFCDLFVQIIKPLQIFLQSRNKMPNLKILTLILMVLKGTVVNPQYAIILAFWNWKVTIKSPELPKLLAVDWKKPKQVGFLQKRNPIRGLAIVLK